MINSKNINISEKDSNKINNILNELFNEEPNILNNKEKKLILIG